jgi:SAM-dependent methyltransferase
VGRRPPPYLALARSSLAWGKTATRIIREANQSDVVLRWRPLGAKVEMRLQRLRPTAQYTRALPGLMLINMRQRIFLPRTWSSLRRARSRQAMAAATNSRAASVPKTSFFRFASIAQIYPVTEATRTSDWWLLPFQLKLHKHGDRHATGGTNWAAVRRPACSDDEPGPTIGRMSSTPTFDALVTEAASVPLEGWDFSWFEGRATEERPSWGYARVLVQRIGRASAVLDIQTGGGEVFAAVLSEVEHLPARLAATEAWPPNVEIAARNLSPYGVSVIGAANDARLPFADGSFDLAVSRHPVVTVWDEVSRVLAPGGSYLSQQVGAGSNRELIDFMMGPQTPSEARSTTRAISSAQDAGLLVVDVRQEQLRVVFNDVGAVVYFLRKVLWTVPDFSADKYRRRLLALHERIRERGPFVAHAQRFLIEAKKPDGKRAQSQ